MLEMASSAGILLLPTTDRTLAAPLETHVPLILGISIPFPLVLPDKAGGMLMVSLDVFSGQSRVQSQVARATAPSNHLMATFASAPSKTSTAQSTISKCHTSMVWNWILTSAKARWQPAAPAVADVVQGDAGQNSQYTIHPAILDNCTQVIQGLLLNTLWSNSSLHF